ncbi:hypothetical protein AOXY_G287 [Acipenser oxyrinchus oxyrinchus]|uniref:Uncharacterized protein n=1 Tax=Acipenser oxyrinchus oxyrinchus TaxID=40147 RepID=A0AAD8GKB5_ACIOX|nr:hypothetical protein AOXY_G287 [Acipenser oxyrinchus oxyrinchus]
MTDRKTLLLVYQKEQNQKSSRSNIDYADDDRRSGLFLANEQPEEEGQGQEGQEGGSDDDTASISRPTTRPTPKSMDEVDAKLLEILQQPTPAAPAPVCDDIDHFLLRLGPHLRRLNPHNQMWA